MRIAQPMAVVVLAALAVSVSGCNGMRRMGNTVMPGQPFGKTVKLACKQSDKDYVGAKEMPPLKAPAGLESPDTRNALKVPALNTPERTRGVDEACLDAPPPFTTVKAATAPTPPPPPRQPREVPTQ
jgi:uncharacterized lipoprotein